MEDKEHLTCTKAILTTIKQVRPRTAADLMNFLQKNFSFSEEKMTDCLIRLEAEGKVVFRENKNKTSVSGFSEFLFSGHAHWYLATVLIDLAAIIFSFTISANASPFIYARYVFGILSTLFLTGYCVVRIFFPEDKNYLEKILLSIGISVFLVFIIGLLLNYSPFGLDTVSVMLATFFLTLSLATTGIVRDYRIYQRV